MLLYRFNVNVSYDEFMLVYQGAAKNIVVREFGGKTISLPAGKFISFIDHSGLHGCFELQLTSNGKFIALNKLS